MSNPQTPATAGTYPPSAPPLQATPSGATPNQPPGRGVAPEDFRSNTAAICAQTDPDLWFPIRNQKAEGATALKLCRSCPLTAPCLDWALTHGEYGIWGATTERQRNVIRAERGITVDIVDWHTDQKKPSKFQAAADALDENRRRAAGDWFAT